MISCVLGICADTILIDAALNSLSIVNVYEEISPESFPIVLPRIAAVFELIREQADPERGDGVITFSLGERELMRAPQNIDFQGKLRIRTVVAVHNLIIAGPGLLRVQFVLAGNPLCHWDIPCVTRSVQMRLEPQAE